MERAEVEGVAGLALARAAGRAAARALTADVGADGAVAAVATGAEAAAAVRVPVGLALDDDVLADRARAVGHFRGLGIVGGGTLGPFGRSSAGEGERESGSGRGREAVHGGSPGAPRLEGACPPFRPLCSPVASEVQIVPAVISNRTATPNVQVSGIFRAPSKASSTP